MSTRMVVVLLAVVALAAACTSKPAAAPSPTPSTSNPGPTGTATPAASPPSPTSTSLSPPPGEPAGGFSPLSVTFVSLQTGWVLGSTCGACAMMLLQTRDGGKTWASVPAPPITASESNERVPPIVRFANLDDGWVMAPELWATHDGGIHWAKQTFPGATQPEVTDVEASNGAVHAVVISTSASGASVLVESSPVHRDAWKASPTRLQVGAGPVPEAHLVLQGPAGWAIENDRVVIGGARLVNGGWVSWQPPCIQSEGPATLAASTPGSLVAVCDEGQFGGPPVGVRAYFSTDGGLSFRKAPADLPLQGLEGVASPAPGVVFAAGTEPAGQGVAPRIIASRDGGSIWTPVFQGFPDSSVMDLGFTSATQGVAIDTGANNLRAATLLMTHDGGSTWQPVPLTAGR